MGSGSKQSRRHKVVDASSRPTEADRQKAMDDREVSSNAKSLDHCTYGEERNWCRDGECRSENGKGNGVEEDSERGLEGRGLEM